LGLRGDIIGNGRLGAGGKIIFILLDQQRLCACSRQVTT